MDPNPDTSEQISTTSTAYINNLRSDKSHEELEREVLKLFELIGVIIQNEDIKIHRRSAKKPAYGFVNLKDKTSFDICVEKLNGFAATNAKELIFPGKNLEVNEARNSLPSIDKNTRQAKHKNSRKHLKKSKTKMSNNSNAKNMNANNVSIAMASAPIVNTDVTMTTGSTTLPTRASNHMTELKGTSPNFLLSKQNYLDRPGLGERCYFAGQKLGTEDRLTEYKEGGGNYLDLRFKNHIAKYVCAFLNSEGGTLLVGVKDDCTVCGIEVSSQREDQLRLAIDKIMKGFYPLVFPNLYKVDFIPVLPFPPAQESPSLQAVKTVIMHQTDTSDFPSLNVVSDSAANILKDNHFQLRASCDPKRTPTSNSCISEAHGAAKEHPCVKGNSLYSLSQRELPISDGIDTLTRPKSPVDNLGCISPQNSVVRSDLKVIEVKIYSPCHMRSEPYLYENYKGEVYLRRDGSIQGPLKPSQIQEWIKQNIGRSHYLEKDHLQQEIQRKQDEIEINMKVIKELAKQKVFIEEQHQEKMTVLTKEINLLKSQIAGQPDQIQKTNSKVCILL